MSQEIAAAYALGLVPAPHRSTALCRIWRGLTFQPATRCFVKRVADGYCIFDRNGRFLGGALQRDVRRFLGRLQDEQRKD